MGTVVSTLAVGAVHILWGGDKDSIKMCEKTGSQFSDPFRTSYHLLYKRTTVPKEPSQWGAPGRWQRQGSAGDEELGQVCSGLDHVGRLAEA